MHYFLMLIGPNNCPPPTARCAPSQDTPYVAPLIEVKPGNTVRINLDNQLEDEETCKEEIEDINTPHCFNTTNLHTHGLWISPTGNSDNVLLSVKPGNKFQYEFNLPPDHPAGTFWYHPHQHGSTALQVSSGMVGALIVRGDRLPSETANGDIDTLLQGTPEETLVLQQIQYYCPESEPIWNCGSGETGVIESYNNFGPNGPNTWKKSGRHTSINGKVQPIFEANAGKMKRWRLIHAGVRESIRLQFFEIKDASRSKTDINIDDCKNEPKDELDYHIIADDGLTRSKAWKTSSVILQPGYRNDALVIFPKTGRYCVVDAPEKAEDSVTQNETGPKLLGTVKVVGGKPIKAEEIPDNITNQLVLATQQMMLPKSVEDTIIKDLKNGLKLEKFIPHSDLTDLNPEDMGHQELAFNIDPPAPKPAPQIFQFQVGNSIQKVAPAGCGKPGLKPYDPNCVDRHLTLGQVDEWLLTSFVAGHPFHIHVNPFQVVAIHKVIDNQIQPEDLSLPDSDDQQYRGLHGVWKDTLWIKAPTDENKARYQIVVRTRYQRYIGEFVLHCHILDHEDQGMMQNIEIVLPDV